MRPWNVLVTSFEGQRNALLGALRRLGDFHGGGYRNVLVGNVPDPPAFLEALRERLATDRRLAAGLARVVIVDVVVPVTPEDAATTLAEATAPLLDRLATGPAFYVRLSRRGLKGRIDTPAIERAVGDHVWRALEARGVAPRIDFRDPDHVLVIEMLGDQAGLGLVDRAMRTRYPFVRAR